MALGPDAIGLELRPGDGPGVVVVVAHLPPEIVAAAQDEGDGGPVAMVVGRALLVMAADKVPEPVRSAISAAVESLDRHMAGAAEIVFDTAAEA